MDTESVQKSASTVWQLAANQHGVISRRQLLDLGWHTEAIKHRVRKRRLHPVRRGVFALGRPELTLRGQWMAAVLACGPGAFLSHVDAATLWGIRGRPAGIGRHWRVDICVEAHRRPRCEGIRLHRVKRFQELDGAQRDGIPVTSPVRTLIDLATVLGPGELETAINEADRLGLVDPRQFAGRHCCPDRPARCPRASGCPRSPHVQAHRLRARAPLPTPRKTRSAAKAPDPAAGQRLQGRLLLARARTGGRDGRTPVSPDPRPTGPGQDPRPEARHRGPDRPPFQSRPGCV